MDQRGKVLFVCNYYSPNATIAAVRTTKVVKYLKKSGYHVDFLSVDNPNLAVDKSLIKDVEGVNVKYAYNSKKYLAFEKTVKKILDPIKQLKMSDLSNRERVNPRTGHMEFYPFETAYPLIGSIYYLLSLSHQKDLFLNIKKWIDKVGKYDYLITSYGDAFCYYVGLHYHKIYPETKWIFDIRDAVYRYKFTPKYISYIPLMMESRIWRNADAIIGVSDAICNRVPKKCRKKVHKVTNGYDSIDRRDIDDKLLSMDKLILTFTGSLYGGLQNLTPLFRAIKELIDTKRMDKKLIEFHFAGTESAAGVFKSQLEQYDLSDLMVSHGKLDRHETLKLQSASDLLLTPSYDYEYNKGGILTGKFFEYMSSGHPQVVIVTGDIKRSEIATITRQCELGVAYEQSHDANDYPELKSYLMNWYEEKMEKGWISFTPNYNKIKKYDYKNIVRRLVNIMESM